MLRRLIDLKSSSLIKVNLPNLIVKRNKTDHLYGVERVQYFTMKKKAKIVDESDNVTALEDDDMLSVYLTKKLKRTQTTEKYPIYVPSWESNRLICCHCDVEGLDLTYTLLKKNEITKCQCSYHFKLIDQLDPFSKLS